MLRSDQEPAIIALKKAVRDNRNKLDIVMEESVVAEHEMNGAVETAVRQLQCMVRTIKDGAVDRESCIAP